MEPLITKSMLAAAACLAVGLGATTASAADVVKVQVPFPFEVKGQTLPAGQYRLERDDMNPALMLIQGARGTHTNMYVLTNGAAGHDPNGEQPSVTFTKYENHYRLTDVWESASDGRTITAVK